MIIIDWNDKSVKLNPENAFKLPRWTGNDDDTTLYDLAAFLKSKQYFKIILYIFLLTHTHCLHKYKLFLNIININIVYNFSWFNKIYNILFLSNINIKCARCTRRLKLL